jgi:hypothetical protein
LDGNIQAFFAWLTSTFPRAHFANQSIEFLQGNPMAVATLRRRHVCP